MSIERFEALNVIVDDGGFMPLHAHGLDAGYDLLSPIDTMITAGASKTIDTGVHMEIPAGWYGKLESKSGLNVNMSVVSLGGVVDAGFTGSIKVKLYNFGKDDFYIRKGTKLVQIVFMPISTPRLVQVHYFESKSERGDNGFGSTGA